jgi:hypothetical protein
MWPTQVEARRGVNTKWFRGDAHHVVELGVKALHEPASGPPRAHHHHPRLHLCALISGFGAQPRQRSQWKWVQSALCF